MHAHNSIPLHSTGQRPTKPHAHPPHPTPPLHPPRHHHQQDVIQFGPMARTLAAQMVRDPGSIPQLIAHVGPGPLAEWVGHMASLGAYTALHATLGPALRRAAPGLPPRQRYELGRLLDAWEFGSGSDFKL